MLYRYPVAIIGAGGACRTPQQLGSDKDAAYDHHTCPKESVSDLAFAEKHACPDDRQNGTQFEQGGDIPDQAKRNSGEAKEWSNTCKKHCQRYCMWMSIQSLPPTLLTSLSLLTRGPILPNETFHDEPCRGEPCRALVHSSF